MHPPSKELRSVYGVPRFNWNFYLHQTKLVVNMIVKELLAYDLKAITPRYGFVTTCNNEVFNVGTFMHLSIFFPFLSVDKNYFDVYFSTMYLSIIFYRV